MKSSINRVILLVPCLILIISSELSGQDGYKFAPEKRGSVTSTTDYSYTFNEVFPGDSPEFLKGRLNKISSALLSSVTVKEAKGVDINAHSTLSEFTNVELSFRNLARGDDDPAGEYYHKGSSSLNIYINDSKTASGNILRNNFFELPVKVGDFNGFPVYDCGIYKYILVAPGISNPFIPCTKEEYLKAIIKEEREKLKMFESSDKSEVMEMSKILVETEKRRDEFLKTAESLKKSDPEQSKFMLEQAKGMEEVLIEFKRIISENSSQSDDPMLSHNKNIVKSLEDELNSMSESERVKQAVWSQGAQEITGKYSDLIPDNMREHGTPLYKLNPALKHNSERIIFMIVVFFETNPGMERTPADSCVEKIKGESRIWSEIFSLAADS